MLLSRVDIAASASSSRIEMDPNLLVRLFAVLQTLQQPFEAWSQLVHDARAERLISVRSRAAETVRTARQRAKLLEQTAGRLRKQDETLRSLGNRVRLRQLHAHWRAEARERARCQWPHTRVKPPNSRRTRTKQLCLVHNAMDVPPSSLARCATHVAPSSSL